MEMHRNSVKAFLSITPLIIFFFNVFAAPVFGAEEDKRPNILFIIADDQSPFDLKMYNPASDLETPILDKLAAEGMIFDGAYHMGSWSGAVCSPSRRMIMSGRTVWHIPGRGNPCSDSNEMVPENLENNTMAAIFNRAGYATMRTCKLGNSYQEANLKFAVRRDKTKRGETDETGSAWHADQVLDYLNQRQADNDTRPFLIYFGFSHPHDPRNGKVDLLKKYGAVNHTDRDSLPPVNPKQPELPPNYLPAHPFHHGHPRLRDEVSVKGVWEKRDARTIRNELGREYACSENIDIQIGRVLDRLKEMDELDNTYIFYTADHGIAIGRHGLQGKQNLYEHTWRVPFIVKGPGIKAGSRVQGNIYLLDVLGTVCDLAGIEPPETVESKSFKPVLEGREDTVRDVLYGVYSGGTKPGIRSVRKGDWKLIKYDVLNGRVHKTQLFNLKENPREYLKEHHQKVVTNLTNNTPKPNQINLADDPEYADKLAEMEDLLLSEMRRLDDPYRLWNQPPKEKPNIILVMTDDQGYGDLGCHGHPFIKTPNLDKLYSQSTRFTDFHVSPTCAPTRSSLMSGRAPFKNGVTHTILERERMALSAKTVAEVLKTAGYTTGIFGKWHLGDADEYQPDRRGFDEVFIHGAGGIGQSYPGTQGAVPGTGYFDPLIKHNNTFVKTKGYCTDVFFQQALTWIKKSKDRPFFAYIPTNAPHGPYIVAEQYKNLYKDKCDDRPAAFLGMITNIDENMGLLMEKLDEWDLADNTLLIFMTDNGSAAGGRIYNAGMRGYKGSNHEGGARVPLFMRLPGKIKEGVDIDRMARHYDLFPTLAEFAGAKLPEGYAIDGKSLVPLIENPNAEWPDRYTIFHKGRWNKKGAPGHWGEGNTDPDKAKYNGFAVRNEKWRLTGKDELYNIKKDPGEQTNVAETNPEIVKEMLNVFDKWWSEVRPMMVNEDAPLDTGKPFIEHYQKQQSEKGIPHWKPEY